MRSAAFRDIGVIMLLACTIRMALALAMPFEPRWDGAIYERAAAQIAHGEGYTQRALRVDAPARPTSFYPPGFPAYLALGRRIVDSRNMDIALQSLASAALVAATYLIGRRYLAARRARIAAWIVALSPSMVLLSATWLSEPLFAALQTLAIATLVRARRLRAYALSGALFALAGLTRPVALLCAAYVMLALLWRMHRRRTHLALRGARIGVFVLSLGAVLAPWMTRNASAVGAPVISTNGGANLLLGTWGDGRFPANGVPPEIDCPNGMTELARDRCRSQRAMARIAADPLAYVAKIPRKIFDTFTYETSPAQVWSLGARLNSSALATNLLCALCTLAWIALLVAAIRNSSGNEALFALMPGFASTLAMHSLWLSGDRYHLPLWPLLAVLAVSQYPARITTVAPIANS